MITLLLLTIIFILIVVLGTAISIAGPLVGVLIACIAIDCIFLKRLFGKKNKKTE